MTDASEVKVEVKVEGHAARITHPLFHRLLDDHLTQAQQEGRIKAAEISEWWCPLDQAAESGGAFMAAILAIIVAGTVPG
jgi:hypothetical protein